jgi:hypothetical protein
MINLIKINYICNMVHEADNLDNNDKDVSCRKVASTVLSAFMYLYY